MSVQKGRQVRIEIALTYAAAKVLTAITAASPGVASSAAHALAAGTVGFLSDIVGMPEVEGMAAAVTGPVTGAFNLQALDTSGYQPATGGNFTPVATWSTLSQATGYEIGGGEADQLDKTVLLDAVKQDEAGQLAAQTVSINAFSDAQAAALQQVEKDALAGNDSLFRITFKNGERRIFRGTPSLPGESLSVGQLATSGFNVSVKGRVLRLPSTL